MKGHPHPLPLRALPACFLVAFFAAGPLAVPASAQDEDTAAISETSAADADAGADADADSKDDLVTFSVEFADKKYRLVFRLDPEAAPRHVDNFRKLIGEGYYDDLVFHRAIPGYLVQTGDPLTRDENEKDRWGTGGPGYTIPAEIGLPHLRGSIAMARKRKGNPTKASAGSQFYIMLTAAPELDGDYTVFGDVVEGIEILDAMSRVLADSNNNPVKPISVASTRLGGPGFLAAIPNPFKGLPKITVPSMPNISLPKISMPKISMPSIPNPFKRGEDESGGSQVADFSPPPGETSPSDYLESVPEPEPAESSEPAEHAEHMAVAEDAPLPGPVEAEEEYLPVSEIVESSTTGDGRESVTVTAEEPAPAKPEGRFTRFIKKIW